MFTLESEEGKYFQLENLYLFLEIEQEMHLS